MKRLNNKLFISTLFFLTTTSHLYASGAKLPVMTDGNNPTTTATSPAPSNLPPVQVVPPIVLPLSPQGGAYIDQIKSLAGASSCASTSWTGRGRAPAGYIKGVTLSYARSLCRLKNNSSLSVIMSAASSGNSAKDALAHYQSVFSALPLSVTTKGEAPLRAVYVLGMGLGMRESSGSYCEGWDRSAGSNRPSSAAEAGAFQTSYDSMVLSPELRKLYNEYLASPNRCFLDVFKQGASCGSKNILGTGAGADYQAFNIACPAFATEYAMTMLRIQRGHYGPINRKEAQVVPACNKLLISVQDLINNDPYACQDIE
ncbi:MAG: hypothetical protein Q7U04_05275 [Bacteriovorax sp.]|nr:hypothetical protein [Bacteriovorax sp.]